MWSLKQTVRVPPGVRCSFRDAQLSGVPLSETPRRRGPPGMRDTLLSAVVQNGQARTHPHCYTLLRLTF